MYSYDETVISQLLFVDAIQLSLLLHFITLGISYVPQDFKSTVF